MLRGGRRPANRGLPGGRVPGGRRPACAGALAVLATGSLTNLLGAESGPGFFGRVSAISLMGGVTGPLVVGGRPMAELNCSVDARGGPRRSSPGGETWRIATAQNCLDSYFPAGGVSGRGWPRARAPLPPAILPRDLAGLVPGLWNRERWGLSRASSTGT